MKEKEIQKRVEEFESKYEWDNVIHRYFYRETNELVPELEAKLT